MCLLWRHWEVMLDSARHCMAAADACPGFATDINATFNFPSSFKILTYSRHLWGPCSWRLLQPSSFRCMSCLAVVTRTAIICTIACSALHSPAVQLLRISWAVGLVITLSFELFVITLSFGWMRGSCFGSIFFNFSSPNQPPTSWPLRYVSKSPQTVHDINAWSWHSAPNQWTLLIELRISSLYCACIRARQIPRDDVVQWRAWSPVPVCFWFNQCSVRWMHEVQEKLVYLVIYRTCRRSAATTRECRVEVTSESNQYSPLR